MMTVYWQPLDRESSLRRQLDRVFDQSDARGKAKEENCWQPLHELLDRPDSFLIHCHLPGISSNKIDIQAALKTIVISGEHAHSGVASNAADSGSLIYSDLPYGQFQKVIALPLEIDPEGVEADLQDGVLSLVLPKSDRYRTVKVSLDHLSTKNGIGEGELMEGPDQKALNQVASDESANSQATETTVA